MSLATFVKLEVCVCRYSVLLQLQNWSVRCCTCCHCCLLRSLSVNFPGGGGALAFWVRRIAVVCNKGESASQETGTNGLELIMAVTSVIKVCSSSWVRWEEPEHISIESKIFLATPIMRSQAPPICEECGGLKFHGQPDCLHTSVPSSPSLHCGTQARCKHQ